MYTNPHNGEKSLVNSDARFRTDREVRKVVRDLNSTSDRRSTKDKPYSAVIVSELPEQPEFEEKRDKLAAVFYELAYPGSNYDDADSTLQENYLLNAAEFLIRYRHLLSLDERERLGWHEPLDPA